MDNQKRIADIRLFWSNTENIAGNRNPSSLIDRELIAETTRIVMKLREASFSLGDFDHLYINYTTCDVPEDIAPSNRMDKVYRFYRFYDVHVPIEMPELLKADEGRKIAIDLLTQTLIRYFAPDHETISLIGNSIECALAEGSQMRMLYKEKSCANYRASLFLRYSDELKYSPILRVTDSNGALVKEHELPEMSDLSLLGEMQINSKRVVIKPRKSSYNVGINPIVIEL